MVSLKDVAKKAGVTVATVSNALNGYGRMNPKTRERIQEIAKELHYSPNVAGQSLKRGKTHLIMAYVSDLSGYFYSELLDSISKTLKGFCYELIIATGDIKSKSFMNQGLVDGAIILDSNFSTEEINRLATPNCPLVCLDRILKENKNVSSVLLDNQNGAKLAIEALHQAGAEEYVLVSGPKGTYDSDQRIQSAKQKIGAYGAKCHVFDGDFTVESGYKTAEVILDTFKLRTQKDPSVFRKLGVFAANDEMAIGIYRYLHDHENCSEIISQLSIIGFDNDMLDTYVTPTLSSIKYSKRKWGKCVAESLINLIEKQKTEIYQMPTELVIRDSIRK